MRHIGYVLALVALTFCCAAWADSAPATDPAQPEAAKESVAVRTSVRDTETRDYKVTATVKGKLVAEGKPTDIDAVFSYKIRHRYIKRDGDGLMPMEISLVEGEIAADGQKLTITPSLYPKLTVLLDKEWRITDIFGMPDSHLAQTLPGINYGNLIVLFYLPDGAEPRAVGDAWDSTVPLKAYGETFRFTNKIKSVETVNGTKAAVVRQEITSAPRAGGNMKATAESAFSVEGGKLLRSRIECDVFSAPADGSSAVQQELASPSANIKIDIAPIR